MNRHSSLSTESPLKVPPHSIEAEQAILGGIFQDQNALDEIAGLEPDDFYSGAHKIIYSAILDLTAEGKPCDVVTVGEMLEHRHQIDQVGGFGELVNIQDITAGTSNIKAYIEIVKNRSKLRALLRASIEISDSVFNGAPSEVDQILDAASASIIRITEKTTQGKPRHISEFIGSYLDDLDSRYRRKGKMLGLPTGFNDLDQMLSGLSKSDLIIVAGRPSMGKTTLVNNIAEHVAVENKKTVLFFSLEQPRNQLIDRSIASLSRLNGHNVRSGNLTQEDWSKVTETVARMSKGNLVMDDTSAITPIYLRTQARRVQRQYGLDLIIVDYLQLMQVRGAENRTQEISEITRQLKAIAKDFNVPVIALSQLNRGLESRTNKRPMMADLRESGSIEQDADVILFIYRDEVYNEDSPDKGLAEINIGKQRNGPTGKVRLTYLEEYLRFENHVHNWVPL